MSKHEGEGESENQRPPEIPIAQSSRPFSMRKQHMKYLDSDHFDVSEDRCPHRFVEGRLFERDGVWLGSRGEDMRYRIERIALSEGGGGI